MHSSRWSRACSRSPASRACIAGTAATAPLRSGTRATTSATSARRSSATARSPAQAWAKPAAPSPLRAARRARAVRRARRTAARSRCWPPVRAWSGRQSLRSRSIDATVASMPAASATSRASESAGELSVLASSVVPMACRARTRATVRPCSAATWALRRNHFSASAASLARAHRPMTSAASHTVSGEAAGWSTTCSASARAARRCHRRRNARLRRWRRPTARRRDRTARHRRGRRPIAPR